MSLVPDHIRQLVPYPPGKPLSELERELGITNAVKLASNENALGPSPLALQAIRDALPELHRYPDGGAHYLRQRLADHLGVDPLCLVVGNGSNEIIDLLIRTFGGPGRGIVSSECTFVVYQLIAQATGTPFSAAPMRGFDLDLDAMAERVGPSTSLVFLCSPNNPTGTVISPEALDRFLRRVGDDVIVAIDEAYIEYVPSALRPDALGIVARRPRTVVLRTFSKAYGLAGVRAGYGVTSLELADYMNRVRQPFNMSHLAQVAATAALDDSQHLERVLSVTSAGMREVAEGLQALRLPLVPSYANFILFDVKRPAKPVYDTLLRRGVIVRPVGNYGLPNHLRVNMGLPEENARFLSALSEVL